MGPWRNAFRRETYTGRELLQRLQRPESGEIVNPPRDVKLCLPGLQPIAMEDRLTFHFVDGDRVCVYVEVERAESIAERLRRSKREIPL